MDAFVGHICAGVAVVAAVAAGAASIVFINKWGNAGRVFADSQ